MNNNDKELMNKGEVGMEMYSGHKQAVQVSDHAPLEQLQEQVQVIQQTMKSVMKQDEHFGTIPGTNKPTLLKPGAEKLSLLFRLAPEYEVERFEMGDDHREYEVKCRLTHINSGTFIGAGVGSCSTKEKKYRYRNDDIPTDIEVPKAYWDNKDYSVLVRAIEQSGNSDYQSLGTTKHNGRWVISLRAKVENPDIADVYNTVLKMAKKRAHVDAILTATAASDIFTQDVEDMPEFDQNRKQAANNSQGSSIQSSNKQSTNSSGSDDEKPWLNKTKHQSDELTEDWQKIVVRLQKRPEDLEKVYDHFKVNRDTRKELESIAKKVKAKQQEPEPAITGELSDLDPDLPF